MAKCEFCGKGVTFGIKVSHSHRRSNRTWKPNVKRVKAVVKGTPCHVYVCSRCLRSGKVERVQGIKTSLSCMYAKKIREFSDDRLLSEELPIFFKMQR